MMDPLVYLGISVLFAGLMVWAVMPLVHRRAARLIAEQQQAALLSPSLELDKNKLRADLAPSTHDLNEIVQRLKDRITTQSAELDKNAETITQLNVDRHLLKIELDALRLQY